MTSETTRLLANGSPVSTQNRDGAVKVEQAAACLWFCSTPPYFQLKT